MTAPIVRGWCPGAHTPMRSGDGLIFRVRPRRGRLSRAQMAGLCDVAIRYGSGQIDLTNRANLQVRGVREADFDAVLSALGKLELVDADPDGERRRNILVDPFWKEGDLTSRLAERLERSLASLPELPSKVGFAIDTGIAPILTGAPADFRLEMSEGGLILRADGCAGGRPVTEGNAMAALAEMVEFFDRNRTPERRRMATVAAATPLPPEWTDVPPLPTATLPMPGLSRAGAVFGAAFGRIEAAAIIMLLKQAAAPGVRITPWRMIVLEGAGMVETPDFITTRDDALMHIDACPGAPLCPQASVETRSLAFRAAKLAPRDLHVSGCPKGCARGRRADIVLVGRGGRFDLVRNGLAGDTPAASGLSEDEALAEIERLR